MTSITKSQLKSTYAAAEKRAVPCSNGVAFSVEDRVSLNALRVAMNLDCSQIAEFIAGGRNDRVEYQRHYARFSFWKEQVDMGVIRIAPAATGEHVGKQKAPVTTTNFFDGRIKDISDVQPAFNRAARQLIKVGITSPEAAFKYVSMAFETAKVEQKIDIKAERIIKELRMGDLTKDQIMATLDRVKTQF